MPEKKVKVLQSKRPFSSYDNLVSNVLMVRVDTAHLLACLQYDVITSTQGVMVSVLDSCKEMLEEKEVGLSGGFMFACMYACMRSQHHVSRAVPLRRSQTS
jgi:hypothetical protein